MANWRNQASEFIRKVFSKTSEIPNQDLADWMASNRELEEKKFTDLLLPGTHDSGAYKIDWEKRPPFLDKPWQKLLFGCLKVPVVGHIIRNIVERWTLAQTDNIKTQLENGVRLFDFRLGYDEKGEKYISHTFLCEKLDIVLEQIKAFQQKHPGEVLTLNFKMDFPYRDGAPEGFESDCMKAVVDKLGTAIIASESGMSQTLGELRKKGSIIINLGSDKPLPDELVTKIRRNQTEELWTNQSTSRNVIPELEKQITQLNVDPEKLTYAGYMVTPDGGKIARGAINGRSLGHSAAKLVRKSEEFLTSEHVATAGKISGIIADRVDSSFVEKIVKTNKRRQSKGSFQEKLLAESEAAREKARTK